MSKSGADAYFNRTSHSMPRYVNSNTIAFLDDSSGTNQLHLHHLDSGEVNVVTNYSEGILSLDASVATESILFGIDQNGDERQQLYALSLSDLQPKRITHDDGAFFEPGGFSQDGSRVIYRSNTRDESIFDVAVCDIEGGDAAIWFENGGQVLPQDLASPGALVIRSRTNGADDLYLATSSEAPVNLTSGLEDHRVYAAVFDPALEKAWVLSELDREVAGLYQLDLETGTFNLYFEADWEVEQVAVSPDGAYLVISINENGYSVPFILSASDPSDKRSIQVPEGVINGFSWSPDSQTVAIGVATAETPSHVYSSDLQGNTRPLIAAQEQGPPQTVTPESIKYTTFDGREIPAYLYLPAGEGPHPALVEIHGGPESQRRPEYGSTGASIQYLVSRGIAVLALNIRGSIGYGREYRHLDDTHKRLDALKDVEYAASWLKQHERIDGDRLAVFGISYGGYMTLSAVTRLPDTWAVAAEMVGMAHLETFLERTGAWRRKHREAEYGSLETDREMLRAVSPLPLVDQIKAPLLVLHGRNDARVPLFESEQIVEAVSKRGVPIDLVIYDDEGHIFTKRKNLVDAYERIADFVAEHLGLATRPDL